VTQHPSLIFKFLIPATPINFVPDSILKPPYVINKTKDNFYNDIEIKNEKEIEQMREACQIARKALDYAETLINPEITTDEIDKKVHKFIVKKY
jgi:methionyl aminopeptidase